MLYMAFYDSVFEGLGCGSLGPVKLKKKKCVLVSTCTIDSAADVTSGRLGLPKVPCVQNDNDV